MTTIASFFSVSVAGKRTLSMVSDSRMSWTSDGANVTGIFNNSQKIFRLNDSLDVIGYCGDSLFCLSNISQIVSYINNSTLFSSSNDISLKENMLQSLLDSSLAEYPENILTQDFTIYFNSFTNENFYSSKFSYDNTSKALVCTRIDFNNTVTSLVFHDGSGDKFYKSALTNLKCVTDQNGKYISDNSRTYFKALMDVIDSGVDPKTGGPPQMIIIRESEADLQSISFLYNGKYYLNGIHDIYDSNTLKVEYKDTDFNFRTPDGKIRNNFTGSYVRLKELPQWKMHVTQLHIDGNLL